MEYLDPQTTVELQQLRQAQIHLQALQAKQKAIHSQIQKTLTFQTKTCRFRGVDDGKI